MVYIDGPLVSDVIRALQHELDANGDHPLVISGSEATPTRITCLNADGCEENDPAKIAEYYLEG